MSTPGNPSTQPTARASVKLDRVLTNLHQHWGIRLPQPKDGESPSKRSERLNVASKAERCASQCASMINFLCFKDPNALSTALTDFHNTTQTARKDWVNQPNPDGDLLPRSSFVASHAVSGHQLDQLLESLLRHIEPVYQQVKERQKREGRASVTEISHNDNPGHAVTPNETYRILEVDYSPIPCSLGFQPPGNIPHDEYGALNNDSTRAKGFLGHPLPRRVVVGEASASVTTVQANSERWTTVAHPAAIEKDHLSGVDTAFEATRADHKYSSSNGDSQPKQKQPTTAGTSFTTILSSVFDSDSDASDDTFSSPLAPVPDSTPETKIGPELRDPRIEISETEYGSSFDPDDVLRLVPQNTLRYPPEGGEGPLLEDQFKKRILARLQNIFPSMPPSLEAAPFPVRYEVTRICSYTGVNVAELKLPNTIPSIFSNYDKFWEYLRNHPALEDKIFPEKSDGKAWRVSWDTFRHGFDGVVFSGRFEFSNLNHGPLFKFQLQPLKLDRTYRLSRRFGCDRFLEMTVPSLNSKKLSKWFKSAGEYDRGKAHGVIAGWLTNFQREVLLGILWEAFFVKGATKRKKNVQQSSFRELDSTARFCIYFFATDGVGFQHRSNLDTSEPAGRHVKLTMSAMINWLIPLEVNKEQKALKLYSRIALGLSKSRNTVVVQPAEFRDPPDLMSDKMEEVMNDGCGRLSWKMALGIIKCLGLDYVPSGFQARIGGAKGFWIVDANQCDGQQWIEIYPSQVKWKRNEDLKNRNDDDPEHRTFEVVSWVRPLKAATLNLQFLPLLVDRGRDPKAMRDAISDLFTMRIAHENDMLRAAMDSPQDFRNWVSHNYSGTEDRLKHGRVRFIAGLPSSREEQLNMLLDAGFNPRDCVFLRDLVHKAYNSKCAELKEKLNITVGRSTYAFMAVDFSDTLGPNEVHLAFSNSFTDELSGFSETSLNDVDILVARSPAHSTSDIQKVKAVWKPELQSLKDVIVFSSKGDYPLAKRLSGGDYDGDMAWICFEPSIVNEFVNIDPPDFPNLVALGHIVKEQTEYSDFVSENDDAVSAFLHHGFKFNLQESLLGECTTYKEHFCYTAKSVSNKEALFLSSLLSALVDQSKQGYIFTSESWKNIKDNVIKTKPRVPAYKQGSENEPLDPLSCHIIDHLKFWVAENAIESALSKFNLSLPNATYHDPDILRRKECAQNLAKTSPDWAQIIGHLEQEIGELKEAWSKRFACHEKKLDSSANFSSIVTSFYEKWVAIAPPSDGPLAAQLVPIYLIPQERIYSPLSLLKASVGYVIKGKYSGKFIWWMAGRELVHLKASSSQDGDGAPYTPVTAPMYALLKPDGAYVRRLGVMREDESGYLEDDDDC